MVNSDRTQRDFIRGTVREMLQNSRVGVVQNVYTHTADDDNSNFEVDVGFPENPDERGHRGVPIVNPHGDIISIPKVGDKVVVKYIHGDKMNPLVQGFVNTNKDRPSKGEAGMWRHHAESGETATGDGDLYLTSHSRYSENPANNNYNDLDVEQAFVRIAKKADALDEPTDDPPMLIELFDEPLTDESRIRLEGNSVDGDTSKSMDVELDFKTGEAVLKVENSTGEFGIKLDVNTGTFTLVDQNGYGIESDGSGNFTWHYESIDYSQGTTTSL